MSETTAIGIDSPGVPGLEDRGGQFDDPLGRLLYLRLESQLTSLPAHELTLLAQHSEERQFEAGETLMAQGAPTSAVHFLVEGRVSMRRDGVTYREMDAPAVMGTFAALSRDPDGVEVVADEASTTLEVSAEVWRDLIEDNFTFMTGALRGVSGQMLDCQAALERKGELQRSEIESVDYPEEPLDLVQRLGLMRGGVYADVNLEALVQLVRAAEEIRLEPGEALWEADDVADFGIHVVAGVVRCEEPDGGRVFRMGPGSVVGVLEANTGRSRSYGAVAETRLVAIRTRTERFFDVLEDHTELGMGLLAFLSRMLVQLQVQLARSSPT